MPKRKKVTKAAAGTGDWLLLCHAENKLQHERTVII